MAIVVFILILSFLVFIHELGHYAVAKKCGIRVEEFGLGLPPRIWGKKIGETIYSINWLPFGGFVKLTGEDFQDRDEEHEIKELEKDPKSFISKTPFQRILVLIAGVTMNFLFAVAIFYVLLSMRGYKSYNIPLFFDYEFKHGQSNINETIVLDVEPGSPAANSGIELGESIVKVGDQEIKNVQNLRDSLTGKLDVPVEVELRDLRSTNENSSRMLEIIPTADDNGNVILGVYLGKSVSLEYTSGPQKLFSGFLHAFNLLGYSTFSFGRIIGISVENRDISPVSQSVSGPVGIYSIVGGILKYGGDKVLLTLMDYTALISLSFAFVNILPFPALDGGRLIFVIFEWVSGKRINPVFEANIHKIGMLFLLFLFALVTIKDIFI